MTLAVVAALFLALSAASASAALPPSFGSEGAGAGQISNNPQGIAVEQNTGDVYVSDKGNNRIEKFGPEGEFILAFGWGVADGTTAALQTCTTTCFAGIEGPGAGQFAGNEGIAVDNSGGASQGDVYVVDSGNFRVQKFSPIGAFLLTFGGEVNAATHGDVCTAAEAASCKQGIEGPEEGAAAGEFAHLVERSVAVGSTGTVYVGDRNRVQLISPAGVAESEIPLPATGRTENLAVDSAGDIYRVSGELQGVHKYDPSGTELGTARDEAGFKERLVITVGPADRLFVNDLRGGGGIDHHLLTFDAAGNQTASFDPAELPQDGLGIAFSEHAGALYVLNGGRVRIVIPPPPGPLILSQSATLILPTSATLDATVNPEGAATTYRFAYGTTTAYGETTPDATVSAGFEETPVSAPATGLLPRTIYHFHLVAESECEPLADPGHICVTDGPDQEFETLPPVSIDATYATGVTATSATLGTALNPHGSPTTYHFEYGLTTSYETSTPIGSAGSGLADVSRSAQIQGLTPLTTYHYRVVATNGFGTATGPDLTFTTQGAAASLLPDGRQWEMVTPPDKFGSPLEPITEEGGAIQAAADGSGFASIALGPLGPAAQGVRSPNDSQWLSHRDPGGWSTEDITTKNERISGIIPGSPAEYRFFARDLSSGLVQPFGGTPLSPQTTERTPYRREADGEYVPLVTAANVLPGAHFQAEEDPIGSNLFRQGTGVEFTSATPDLSHIVLSAPQVLTPGFPAGYVPSGGPILYELTAGSLQLVSVLPGGEPTTGDLGEESENMRGAISENGNRVFFEHGSNGVVHLYLRDTGLGQTLQLDVAQRGVGGISIPRFQAANSDGSKVFFTDTARLTEDATSGPGAPDLYMCEIEVAAGELACALSDLTVDPNPGEAADVQAKAGRNSYVSAIDPSGDHVYFAANGVLTTAPNAHGEHAVPGSCKAGSAGTCNLYEYDTVDRQLSLVAVLSGADSPDWGENSRQFSGLTARSSPDGRYFTFMSQRSLTGYENRDAASSEPDEEVFLFDSTTGHLSCVSCNPTGARPHGVFDPKPFPGLLVDHPRAWGGKWLGASIPGWTSTDEAGEIARYQSRYLSDSGRLFFNSSDALVPQDTNGVNDVYEYEPPGVGGCTSSSSTYSPTSGGCVSLISSGTSPEESTFLDASESGDDVFFLTQSKLSGSDVDSAFDVYDAHACTATSPCPPSPPPPPPTCAGDACQNPATPPNDATPGSLSFNGAGNVLQCPKGKVKQMGKCVKKKQKAKKHHKKSNKKKSKKQKNQRTASHKGGGGK